MSLPMGLYRAQEASGDSYTQSLVGGVWKVLEMPREVHTSLHYGGKHEKVQGFLENSRDLLYIGLYIELCRLFQNLLICKEPSKVPKSSIGAYKQVRASFGQGTKQVSFQAPVKASLSNKSFHSLKVAYYNFSSFRVVSILAQQAKCRG